MSAEATIAHEPHTMDEGGSVIHGMDAEDKSVREETIAYIIRFSTIVPSIEEQVALIITNTILAIR